MRGNEKSLRLMVDRSFEFPIPMRGNEFVGIVMVLGALASFRSP